MPPLLTAGEYKDLVPTNLADSVVDSVIAREQAAIERLLGAAYDGSALMETHVQEPFSGNSLYLRRRVASVSSVSEQRTAFSAAVTLVANTEYLALPMQGRLLRLGGGDWGSIVVVTYVPVDDSEEWRRALVDLVRLSTSRTGLKSENVAGEYSYTAFGNPEAERSKVLQGLGFFNI